MSSGAQFKRSACLGPSRREPWFMREAHNVKCVDETLDKFEREADITIGKVSTEKRLATNG